MAETLTFFQQGMLLAVMMSAPPLIVATVFGVTVSLVQAITQIQDQTLPYVVKLVSVAATLALLGSWYGSELVQLENKVFTLILRVGK
jgi:type III secretion protein S